MLDCQERNLIRFQTQGLISKYNILLSEEEKAAMKANKNETSDEELDLAAGGCVSCECNVHCAY